MSKKAVDVVLLPSEAMMDKAIEANRGLVTKFGAKIVLNKENCLPHISLAMGCVDESDIADVERVLSAIAQNLSLGGLRVAGITAAANSAGEKVSVFEVERTKQLQLLHEKVMRELLPYLSYEVTRDMIFDGSEAKESTLLWIKSYAEKSSFVNFSPHITVGYGEINDFSFPVEFAASELALCHLGNHCTCREIVVSVKLEKR
jgi:2'-5' RNA ligase